MAKEFITVTVAAKKANITKTKTDLLAVGLFSDSKRGKDTRGILDEMLDGAVENVFKLGDFKADASSTIVLYGNGPTGAKRVLLVGLGEKKKANADTLRKASAVAVRTAVGMKAKKVTLALGASLVDKKLSMTDAGQVIAEGALFGGYKYDEYMTAKDARLKAIDVNVIGATAADVRQLNAGIASGTLIGNAQALARTVANRPANVMYPQALAKIAKKAASSTVGLTCTVLDDKQIAAKKMGGLLAVGKGSARKPRLIVMKYTPKIKAKSDVPFVGLVGKAVTFDSGGISIKPGAGMQDMKMDMSGGAMMLGAIKAIADLKLPVKVTAVIPAAENMPGGGSYRPGDIVTTYSGKTVEIQNTDAEGRMILCDAIEYAKRLKCDVIIDAATLTGACVVALGQRKAAVMSNDDKLVKTIQAASKVSGEQVWHMPCDDEYADMMKSEIADLKNVGGRWAGACSAAAFLRQFAGEEVKWAHLDIAGPGMYDESVPSKSGSSGFGVRLIVSYIKEILK